MGGLIIDGDLKTSGAGGNAAGMTLDPAVPDATLGPLSTSLRRALAILGDPWTMLILKESFNGTRRFGDFRRNLNIPKQTLSLRLAALCQHQMLHRRYLNANAGTVLYVPTAKTFDLADAMYSIWLWHRANPGPVDALPFDLVHVPCGHVLRATYRCTDCHGPVTGAALEVRRTDPPQHDTAPRPRLARRNDAAITAAQTDGGALIAASLVGDIACNEVLYALAQGPRHLLALSRDLQIGQIVLRDRLNKLLDLGLVEERKEGRMSVFAPLKRAEDFLPLILSIAAWGDRWCNGDAPPPEIRLHDCGALLNARYSCDHCDGWVGHGTIRVVPREARP
ncbi:winged helix-turn-helix transcriptional regulator [Pseudooceanicola aestuarii]|uniref:winged helix-turn-helix transcriptional regulator n=1 Tax=Pseudooceanicola aestuarii TaxID=2697319 RepID=UPI0013D1BDD3|nr:winged helix-turn-helix transcriptional regulator [Pseudooceanicola aestuarii]